MTIDGILLTGASGYIGGSVMSTLIGSDLPSLKDVTISALVRKESQVEVLTGKRITPVLFTNLDDLEVVRRIAGEYDLIINTALSFHTGSAKAMIEGLGDRRRLSGRDVHFVHTSGTSNLSDQPVSGAYVENHVFSDKEDIFSYEKFRESVHQYDQRTTDIIVTETGLEHGVHTYIIMPPTIYGLGSGLFNSLSIQIPLLIKQAIKNGSVGMIGDGNRLWNHVHISDLVGLYELIVDRIISGKPTQSGPSGIFLAESGEHSWRQIADGIAAAGVALGALKSANVRSLTLTEASEVWLEGNQKVTELGFASSSRTRADNARELGWKPQKGERDFHETFLLEFEAIAKQGKESGSILQNMK